MALPPIDIDWLLHAALNEDLGKGDLTSSLLLPPTQQATARIVARESLTVCGIELAQRIFLMVEPLLDCRVQAEDGQQVGAGASLLEIEGSARAILAAERTALNMLGRLCAVASLTHQYVEAIKGTNAIILDTRKTLPGYRALDKYAVQTGGGRNHRMGLDDGVLIKDNHIALCGSVTAAVQQARAGVPVLTRIEAECETIQQVEEALDARADMVLLDNMSTEQLREVVALVDNRTTLEASGNISLENVRSVAETGVHYISVGKLTHSAPNRDIGLDMALEEQAVS